MEVRNYHNRDPECTIGVHSWHHIALGTDVPFVLPALFVRIAASLFFRNEMGNRAHFLFVSRKMNLLVMLEKTLPGLGYELVDVELAQQGLVRVFIDRAGGVGIEDCVAVSDHLTRLFTVENVNYERLEVSSPGLDRPLKKAADFERFRGQQARFQLRLPHEGLRKFQGVIGELTADTLTIHVEGRLLTVELVNIDKARLVPQIKFR